MIMFSIFTYEFMRNALIAGALASIACGIIGTFVVSKRIVFMSGGIAHSAFGGIGLGYFLGIDPVLGALMFTAPVSVMLGMLSQKAKISEDSVIGIIWSMGMALGIVFIGLSKGYAPDLNSYLFGNILLVPQADLWIMLGLDLAIVAIVTVFFREFRSLCFDEEMSRVLGMPTGFLYILLLVMVALTVVILIRVVGIILVIALLTIPATMARQLTYSMPKMIIWSVALSFVFCFGGLLLSYWLDVASGATIILLAGSVFFIFLGIKKILAKRSQPALKQQ